MTSSWSALDEALDLTTHTPSDRQGVMAVKCQRNPCARNTSTAFRRKNSGEARPAYYWTRYGFRPGSASARANTIQTNRACLSATRMAAGGQVAATGGAD